MPSLSAVYSFEVHIYVTLLLLTSKVSFHYAILGTMLVKNNTIVEALTPTYGMT